MDAVILQATVSKDHKLIVDLPPDMPIGPVTVTIQPTLTRHEIQQRLRSAGRLSAIGQLAGNAQLSSAEESERLARLFGGDDFTALDIINQDRGDKQ